ncbi:hypothetical protein DY037_07070 [Apilactobacillus micheneri]|nr:hypothetical protein DY037_07070 [Apilactobacillus micheneri]
MKIKFIRLLAAGLRKDIGKDYIKQLKDNRDLNKRNEYLVRKLSAQEELNDTARELITDLKNEILHEGIKKG